MRVVWLGLFVSAVASLLGVQPLRFYTCTVQIDWKSPATANVSDS